MRNTKNYKYLLGIACLSLTYTACKTPTLVKKTENRTVPASYSNGLQDTVNSATIKWREYFTDTYLTALIDTALSNNQELNIRFQEIIISQNEIRARKGEYLPFVGLRAGAGVDKVPRYTNIGALEANTEIKPDKEMPEPLADFMIGPTATWEVDIWKKLRNAKKAAVSRYLASVEGRNFLVTNLVAEIANAYYELLALDNQLAITKQNIAIQSNALEIVKLQKEAARTTELAVRRFEAEVAKTRSMQFDIRQDITETENRINFLLGRFPQAVARNAAGFDLLTPNTVQAGIPSQLLANRPDIRQAENNLAANKLDVKVAKAQFYPSVRITAAAGYQAFNPTFLFSSPESILFSLAGDMVAPLVNRNGIKAAYYSANARQIQAAYDYERTILNAYVEVVNQLAMVKNLDSSYSLKSRQVQALTESIEISNSLFKSARADYMEVLLTQRDALEARLELIETKRKQMNAMVNIYQALGGGWN
jgi:multidrug efflux system outer membrane protein